MGGLPLLGLWLIGLGIQVIWNRPRIPQDNAKVERCQGTLGKWTEYKEASSCEELQEVLTKEAHFYNFTFRDRRKEGTTRIERHPNLRHSGKSYTKDTPFEQQRVADFVSKGKYHRVVSTMGQINIGGECFSIGRKYHHQQVTLKLDAQHHAWVVSDTHGVEIGRSPESLWLGWMAKIRGIT